MSTAIPLVSCPAPASLSSFGAPKKESKPGHSVGEGDATAPARYRPDTAFIMMSMDRTRPELIDVADAVKQVFELFDVRALRADDLEGR
jgi:hypothetical protein